MLVPGFNLQLLSGTLMQGSRVGRVMLIVARARTAGESAVKYNADKPGGALGWKVQPDVAKPLE